MFNISELISDKTGVVVFVRKDGEFYCSESFDEALKEIFNTRASVEYIDLDTNYRTMRVDASADVENKIIMLRVPKECGSNGCNLRLTFSAEGGITAEEDNTGGGSGGVSSWNDLTDKPFGTVEKEGYIIPETTAESTDTDWLSFTPPAALWVSGRTYTVNWNGTDYNCTAAEMDVAGDGSVIGYMLGNMTAMGGDDSGEPFVIIGFNTALEAVEGAYLLASDISGAGVLNATFSVYGLGEFVNTLNEKYLPETNNAFYAEFEAYSDPDNSFVIAKLIDGITYDMVKNAISKGRQIYLKLSGVDGIYATYINDGIGSSEGKLCFLSIVPNGLSSYTLRTEGTITAQTLI